MTIEEFTKLPIYIQGALWPVCKTCKHSAQSHDTHISRPLENNCCEVGIGQCAQCGNWGEKVRCSCKGYDGPENVDALTEYLNRKK